MIFPICGFDAKNAVLCPQCETKIETGELFFVASMQSWWPMCRPPCQNMFEQIAEHPNSLTGFIMSISQNIFQQIIYIQ